MILGRLIAWFSFRRAALRHERPGDAPSALDPDEFARLLRSGDPADLKRIARDLSFSDPGEIRQRLQRQLGK